MGEATDRDSLTKFCPAVIRLKLTNDGFKGKAMQRVFGLLFVGRWVIHVAIFS
jgi:hypothetical protein